MFTLRLFIAAVSLVAVSSASKAFQEQEASAPRQQQEAVAGPAIAPLAPDAPAPAKGTPVRIPGLGTLGVIPKMDFGLELLYGAAETTTKRPDPSKSEQDDVLAGARIKHKF